MNNQSVRIIFGPPGTGKTTSLLSVVDEYLKRGLLPERICFVGFTRRSANEARIRAMEKFGFKEDQLPWFRTLHSLAFQMLNLSKNNVMTIGDYIALSKQLGLSITVGGYQNDDGTFAGQTKGDRLFFAETMARSRMMDLRAYWETIPDEDIYYYELLQLREAVEAYKNHNNKLDYTDIITEYSGGEQYPVPSADVLVVDEAQDLSPLQWSMVEKLSNGIGITHIAGDDDQAIFRWAGSDVEHLIRLEAPAKVLTKSYRVPRAIQKIATQIADRIQVRVKKEWEARDCEGVVEYENLVEQIDMSKGTWLLLARNTYLLEPYRTACLGHGYLYEMRGDKIVGTDTLVAIDAWEALRKGREISAGKTRYAYELLGSGTRIARGYKGKFDDISDSAPITMAKLKSDHGLVISGTETWDVALDRIPPAEREYYLRAQRNGEDLFAAPRIRISTIHGAKGAEADNVVVIPDMALRTFNEMEKFPDDEHRVWYVAVTRARERLVILSPMTDRYYRIVD